MIIGLTGGIATGKSESAKHFKALGAYIIDADAISHKLTAKGMPALNELVKVFGTDILMNNGCLNRKKLAEIIFADSQAKLEVEKILHAYIIAKTNAIVSAKYRKYDIVINAPLLFEVGLDRICDKIVVVWIPYLLQVKRLAARDKINGCQIKKRIGAQMPIEKKMDLADYIIDNSGTKKELAKKVKEIYSKLKAQAAE
ncbi:MAG: dephospho-CoA kinase [Endomicrobium sp.]|jgi:dephospho-CoA kinase|nr:dephospho-CoA kinase [Endomicrobium sp.]